MGNGPEGEKFLWNIGDFCSSVCSSPQAISGLKSALSGLKSALASLKSVLSGLKYAHSDSRPQRADIRPERGWGDGQMDVRRSPVFFRVIEILFTSSVTLLHR